VEEKEAPIAGFAGREIVAGRPLLYYEIASAL
jgi:hypothetical protein